MKRRIAALLALCCILVGCTAEQSDAETTVPQETTESTESGGLYESGSAWESESAGAVRCYPLGTSNVTVKCCAFGDNILLVTSTEESTAVSVLGGKNLAVVTGTQLEAVDADALSLQVSGSTVSYYDSHLQRCARLDAGLRTTAHYDLPEAAVGSPLLTADGKYLYYCTSGGVRVLDTESGIDRVLREMQGDSFSVTGLLLNGTVLECRRSGDGMQTTVFLSTENGQLLGYTDYEIRTCSNGDKYYVNHAENGLLSRVKYGESGGTAYTLELPSSQTLLGFLPEADAAVAYTYENTTLCLHRYDLASGRRTACVTLTQAGIPSTVFDAPNGGIYFLTTDAQTQENILCLWSPEESPVGDDTVYAELYYTQDAPDSEGLAECRTLAQQIGEKHGLQILVGEDAVTVQPWDYSLREEYLVPIIRRELALLDERLSHYPDGVLSTLASNFDSVTILLVRSISGTAESGSLATVAGLQFWDENRGYLALCTTQDTEYSLYHELCHMIDTQVLSCTNAYDKWNSFNPSDFSYDNSYAANAVRDGSKYLTPGSEAFIDTYSMSYAKEDRARIMEYAMTDGHETLFRSSILQSKLKQICIGIREAFGLENSTEQFLWEQYLWTPLAAAGE